MPKTENNRDPESIKNLIQDQFKISSLTDEDYSEYLNAEAKSTSPEPVSIETESVGNFKLSLFDEDDSEDSSDDVFAKPVNSAFDINLAEFPIAYLNRGGLPKNANKTEISYCDTIRGRDGKPVERVWTVQAQSTISGKELKKKEAELGRSLTQEEKQLGFGGPQTLEVIYELFQLWKDQGFSDSQIHIGTYYHLLKRLNWCTGKSDYELLKKTLNCIHGIHIKAENAVYLPKMDRYENKSFYIFPSMNTYSKEDKEIRPDDFLYINVDRDFYEAIKQKTPYYIPFDRHYFKTLTSMEQKLGLMLAKVFTPYKKQQRFEWKRSMTNLANQIPIISEEKRLIKRQFKRICDGLISKNFPFLSKYSFENDNIIFYNNLQTSLNINSNVHKASIDVDTLKWLIDEQLKICGDTHSIPFYTIVAKYVPVELIYQCLSEAKQEGKIKRKLYTKIIKEKGKKYLNPYVKYDGTDSDITEVNSIEFDRINNELINSIHHSNRLDNGDEIYDDPNN